MIKAGSKVRVTGEDPATRTYMSDGRTIPLGTIVTVKRVTNDFGIAYYFDWEGEERGVYARYTEPVCECSPSTLLLLGCTCSE